MPQEETLANILRVLERIENQLENTIPRGIPMGVVKKDSELCSQKEINIANLVEPEKLKQFLVSEKGRASMLEIVNEEKKGLEKIFADDTTLSQA